MKVKAVKARHRPYLTPVEVAAYLGVSPQMVRVSLVQGAPGWNFPFVKSGSYIRIPKEAFINWYRGRQR